MAIKCPKCGYAKNDEGSPSCNLCGQVLPSASAAPSPPAPPSTLPGKAPAGPADSADSTGIGEVRAKEGSGPYAVGGFCTLKCSLLERPLRLRPDRAVTVGRARESDICVPSQMISRHHGRIFCDKGIWIYEDLKSSNGSRVNGKRVDRVVLQSGDVLDVGGFLITYREIHALSDVSDTSEEEGKTMTIDPQMLRRAGMSGLDGVAMLGGLGGSLEDIAIPDILQLLETQRKSGTLSLDFGGAAGKIHMVGGMIVNADYGKLTGEIAVHRMLGKTKGTFHFDPRVPKVDQVIHRATTTVLMDAARALDEKGQG